jgi:putative ABC transport system permease protein
VSERRRETLNALARQCNILNQVLGRSADAHLYRARRLVGSRLLTVAIPPLRLYSGFYKTAKRAGEISCASFNVMITSFLILALVGVVSGFWPARKASRLEPIEALRAE